MTRRERFNKGERRNYRKYTYRLLLTRTRQEVVYEAKLTGDLKKECPLPEANY
jgi:hypothetical protein